MVEFGNQRIAFNEKIVNLALSRSDPKIDAHFTYVSSVQLTSLSPSPDKAMDIGPIAGGVGGGLLLLAGLCGLAWKLRRMRATPKSSGLELPQGLQGSVSPVRLLEAD